jgi:small conductance mechanosensitive channel
MPTDLESFVQILTDFASNRLPEFILRLLLIVVLFIVGRWLARWLGGTVERWLTRSRVDTTVASFLGKTVYITGLVFLVVAALTLLGVPTNSIVAVLGASTLAIGLALQDSLANLASGLLLIFLKPFKDGDFVAIGDGPVEGAVKHIEFFHTELAALDNRTLLVPNREVMDNPIVNYTNLAYRRIDLMFGIDYNDDLRKAKRILQEIIAAEPRILAEPQPRIAVGELGDSSVNLICQPCVKPADYLAVKYELIEKVKLRFDEEGVTIPYPQRVLRVVQEGPDGSTTDLGTIVAGMA